MEIVVGIAIIGILVFFAVSVFGSSLSLIFTSGNRSEALHEAVSEIELAIAGMDGEEHTLVVGFSGIADPVSVSGRLIEATGSSADLTTTLSTFIAVGLE